MGILSLKQRRQLNRLQGKRFPIRKVGGEPKVFVVSLFARLDTNKDGRLTKREAKLFWRINQRYDRNKDDVLDKAEIQLAIAQQKQRAEMYNKKFDEAIGRR